MTSAIGIREVRASAESETFWAASTTATTSVIAADVTRVAVHVVNNTNGKVYFRFDATAPTSAANGHHWYLDAGERWEVNENVSALAMSVIAAATDATRYVVFHMATAA